MLAFTIFLLFLSKNSVALELFWENELVTTFSQEEAKERPVSHVIYNPFRKHTRKYTGYDFFSFLDSMYGKKWRQSDRVTFTAADGFIQISSVKAMLQKGASHTGMIAFTDGTPGGFLTFQKSGKQINPGPYYLVWTQFDDRSPASYQDPLKWPYQLRSIKFQKLSRD